MANLTLFIDGEMLVLTSKSPMWSWGEVDVENFNEQLVDLDIPIELTYNPSDPEPHNLLPSPELWGEDPPLIDPNSRWEWLARVSARKLAHPTKDPTILGFYLRLTEGNRVRYGYGDNGDMNHKSQRGRGSTSVEINLNTGEVVDVTGTSPPGLIKYHVLAAKNHHPAFVVDVTDDIETTLDGNIIFSGIVNGFDPRVPVCIIAIRNRGPAKNVSLETERPNLRLAPLGADSHLFGAYVNIGEPLTASAVDDSGFYTYMNQMPVKENSDLIIAVTRGESTYYLPEGLGTQDAPISFSKFSMADVTWKTLSKIYMRPRDAIAPVMVNFGRYDNSIDVISGDDVGGIYMILPHTNTSEVSNGWGRYAVHMPKNYYGQPRFNVSRSRFVLLDGDLTAEQLPNRITGWEAPPAVYYDTLILRVPLGRTGLVFLPFSEDPTGTIPTNVQVDYGSANRLFNDAIDINRGLLPEIPMYGKTVGVWSTRKQDTFQQVLQYGNPWPAASALFPPSENGTPVNYGTFVFPDVHRYGPFSLAVDYQRGEDPAPTRFQIKMYDSDEVTQYLAGESTTLPDPIFERLVDYPTLESGWSEGEETISLISEYPDKYVRYVHDRMQFDAPVLMVVTSVNSENHTQYLGDKVFVSVCRLEA